MAKITKIGYLRDMNTNRFYYFLCNPGSEAFLKEEIKTYHPELKFSFSTKGFVTFKLEGRVLKNNSFVFAHHYGEFVRKEKGENAFEILKEVFQKEYSSENKLVAYDLNGSPIIEEKLNLNDSVIEIIKIKDDEFYMGKFLVNFPRDLYLGGFFNVELPAESPSRAYLKIVEGALAVGVDFKNTEIALEIGSSPGGATYALLSKDLEVIGVDPGEMHENCLKFNKFKHHRVSIQDFDPKLIDKKIDWLLVDMNLSPEASLNEIEKIFKVIQDDFKGAFLTLKMTKIHLVGRIEFYKKIIDRLGLQAKFLTQLPSHKQEFLMFVTKK